MMEETKLNTPHYLGRKSLSHGQEEESGMLHSVSFGGFLTSKLVCSDIMVCLGNDRDFVEFSKI
jgi:hypothetical protein